MQPDRTVGRGMEPTKWDYPSESPEAVASPALLRNSKNDDASGWDQRVQGDARRSFCSGKLQPINIPGLRELERVTFRSFQKTSFSPTPTTLRFQVLGKCPFWTTRAARTVFDFFRVRSVQRVSMVPPVSNLRPTDLDHSDLLLSKSSHVPVTFQPTGQGPGTHAWLSNSYLLKCTP